MLKPHDETDLFNPSPPADPGLLRNDWLQLDTATYTRHVVSFNQAIASSLMGLAEKDDAVSCVMFSYCYRAYH